jgi:hypothetical protein
MILDASLPPMSLKSIPATARVVEEAGFFTLWVSKTKHDPFFSEALISEYTKNMN